jgi:hypothetical protein
MNLDQIVENNRGIITVLCAIGVFLEASYLGVMCNQAIRYYLEKRQIVDIAHLNGRISTKPNLFNTNRLYNSLFDSEGCLRL